MSPIRVDLTMRLADGARRHRRPPAAWSRRPMADRRPDRHRAHARADRGRRAGRHARPATIDLERGLGTDDNPVLQGHAPRRRPRGRRERRGLPPGVERRVAAQRQHHRRAAPRDARPGQRLLHLQRRRGRHPVPARPGRRAGRVRRRRRPPRRRRREDLLGRPAGAHHLAARDRADALPRHRLPERQRRSGRRGQRGQRGAAARAPATRAGCARSTRSCRRCCASSRPTSWSPSTAATPTSRTRSPT